MTSDSGHLHIAQKQHTSVNSLAYYQRIDQPTINNEARSISGIVTLKVFLRRGFKQSIFPG